MTLSLHSTVSTASEKMAFIKVALLAFVAVISQASGDVTVGVSTVMCNCAAPNGDNYNKFNQAADSCNAYPQGSAGFASCLTNSLGFLSNDGRSVDVEGLQAMYGDAGANCDAPGIANLSLKAKTWAWPGSFDFASLDAALNSFYACANAAAVVACENQLRESLGNCKA